MSSIVISTLIFTTICMSRSMYIFYYYMQTNIVYTFISLLIENWSALTFQSKICDCDVCTFEIFFFCFSQILFCVRMFMCGGKVNINIYYLYIVDKDSVILFVYLMMEWIYPDMSIDIFTSLFLVLNDYVLRTCFFHMFILSME